jgi:photosystem II stability/assembly factor-like uncharacterized protein
MKKVIIVLVGWVVLGSSYSANASGESIGSISHIHNVKVMGKTILLGTHEGLYILKGENSVSRVGEENLDLMGLSINGNRIYGSGHPGAGSRLPNPVGLLVSTDAGKSWKKVSLQGKVDFHLLESAGKELYGADSQSGNLLYSTDAGSSWSNLGKNLFSEVAINPMKRGEALAIRKGALVWTTNSFKDEKIVSTKLAFTQIEWSRKTLIASSGSKIFTSVDQGRTWKTRFTFDKEVGTIAQSSELLVVITGSKVWKSKDQGKTFTQFIQ